MYVYSMSVCATCVVKGVALTFPSTAIFSGKELRRVGGKKKHMLHHGRKESYVKPEPKVGVIAMFVIYM